MTIAVINFFILRFFIFLERLRKPLLPKADRWINDGVFQLQRRAFEGNGYTAWEDLEKEIPVTQEIGSIIAELPLVGRPDMKKLSTPVTDTSINTSDLEIRDTQESKKFCIEL